MQQGMNGDKKQARRYHWHSENLTHSAIDGPQGEIVNLTDKRAETSRAAQMELLTDLGPDRIVTELAALSSEAPAQATLPHLIMPAHHDVRSSDVFTRRNAGRWTFPICCSLSASARARSARSRSSPKWCTERPIASAIPRGFL